MRGGQDKNDKKYFDSIKYQTSIEMITIYLRITLKKEMYS